jgi:hypothetical protein
MPVAGDRHGREDWGSSCGLHPKDSAQDPESTGGALMSGRGQEMSQTTSAAGRQK